MLEKMKGIVFFSCRGSRMEHLTMEKPKCLLEIRGNSLLSMQLKAFSENGITEIGVVTGYAREKLALENIKEFYNPDWENSNMVVSLTCAEEWLKNDTCIISYSDIFYESTAIGLLKNADASIAITYDPNWRVLWERRFFDPLDDAETFKINKESEVLEIGGIPKSMDEIEGQYMGLIRFTPDSWKIAKTILNGLSSQNRNRLHMTELLNTIATDSALQLLAIAYNGDWGEVDSPADLNVYA